MIRALLSGELVGSALLGLWILVTDAWLWASAPSHAYGLVAFLVIDALVALAVIEKLAFSSIIASIAALVQFGAMLGDLIRGQPVGVSSIAFRNYLLADSSFVALMAVQLSIVFVGLEMMIGRLLQQHRPMDGAIES